MKKQLILMFVLVSYFILGGQAVKADFEICTNSANQRHLAIDGNIVVWEDERNGVDIYGYDINTSTEFPICTDSAGQQAPAISGSIVVWEDYRNGNCPIFLKNFLKSWIYFQKCGAFLALGT